MRPAPSGSATVPPEPLEVYQILTLAGDDPLREQGIAHFDLAPLLREAQARSPERAWIQRDGGRHWDRDGHDLAASEVARFVEGHFVA